MQLLRASIRTICRVRQRAATLCKFSMETTAHESPSVGSVSVEGLIFDMDGTLTVPYLNFRKLKETLRMPLDRDILAYVSSLPELEQKEAYQIIEDFEEDGMKNLQLQPGIYKLFEHIALKTSMRRAMVTRNNKKAVDAFLNHFSIGCSETLTNNLNKDINKSGLFEVILTRDFQPVKPAPAPVLHICKQWGIDPAQTIFVGDNLDDMLCGKNAGARTILLVNDSNGPASKWADFLVKRLDEIIPILNGCISRKRQ